jgi:MtrB/PioB family decaheme-associated outer membrane protein
MHRLVRMSLVTWLALAAARAAQAQAPTAADPQSAAAAQEQPQTAQPPAAEATSEALPSLFEPTWHQFVIGGRFSSISGDPARFQRYHDFRDGAVFTDARYAREDPDGNWLFRVAGDNVGYRDQRYFADYERTGRFVISGLWDEIPQFYSVDTKTPYSRPGNPLLLDDATQNLIQNGAPEKLNLYVPIAPQFDLRERRDIGTVDFKATPTSKLDVNAMFTSTRHRGELPWGGSFGFSNDVEVPLPYDSRTNDLTLCTEWTNGRQMLRVSYDGSWFDNLDTPLMWDSPLRLTDSTSAPGRGRMALWPSNSSQTISAGGYAKFARRTQLTGFVSYGVWSNNQPLEPFTINSALTQIPLPRSTAEAEAHVFSTNLNLVSRPATDWQFTARLRRYDYNNEMPATVITNYVAYDTSIGTSTTGGPELYAHSRTNFDADAIWSGLQPLALTVGYTNNHNGYDARIFQSSNENVLRLSADAVTSQWATLRAQYEYGSRTGAGLDEDLLIEIGEQPAMRHYDLANRTRNQFRGILDIVPDEHWTFSVSGGVGKDNFPDSYFGLQKSTFRNVSFAADYQLANGVGAGAGYNYERYEGLQRSRSASPGEETDPTRDWTADSAENVHYFSVYLTPPRLGEKTEARLSYDFSHAEGSYFYAIVPGGPLPSPSQLPNVFNKLQQLHLDVRHRLSNRFAATLSYLYEPFRVYDFAFDPTVVNGIVQPSSLVMGYVYRPYTAHSAVVGLMYFW